MPDRYSLNIGDSIRILQVPDGDLLQRDRNREGTSFDPCGSCELLDTATVIEKIIEHKPVVIIDDIDAYQQPWFSVRLEVDDELQLHTLAVTDDDTWDVVYRAASKVEPPTSHLIAEIEHTIDRVLDEYYDEYSSLAERSEKLSNYSANTRDDDPESAIFKGERESLMAAYHELNEKTGLTVLFERLARLNES